MWRNLQIDFFPPQSPQVGLSSESLPGSLGIVGSSSLGGSPFPEYISFLGGFFLGWSVGMLPFLLLYGRLAGGLLFIGFHSMSGSRIFVFLD